MPILMFACLRRVPWERSGDSRAVEPVLAAFATEDPAYLEQIGISLARLKDVRAYDPMLAALQGSDLPRRRTAAYVLGHLGDVRAVDPLLAATVDADPDLRYYAAESLGMLNDVRALPRLHEMVANEAGRTTREHPEPGIRVAYAAIKAVERLGEANNAGASPAP